MDNIVAVARAWVSAFSLRLLVQLRRRSSISLSVLLSAGWIKRRILARDCSPKCSIEKAKHPRVSTAAARENVEHKAPSFSINGVLRIGPEHQAHPCFGEDVHACVKSVC